MHGRQQILQYVATLLDGLADEVVVQPRMPGAREHKSRIAISFVLDSDNVERTTMDTRAKQMDMRVRVVARTHSSGAGSAGIAADAIALQVEKRCAGDGPGFDGVHYVNGARVDIDHDSTSADTDQRTHLPTGELDLSFQVQYHHAPGVPETLV